ncbi:PRD domain-containing protein [Fictibacillus enclensis]|uniref:PRD domain-containing protein n=1 Tax=Fictibacillus enclensis TaxID=1017270 RepID=UPI0025A23B63|nr:PRD domain-containing protein [Fictibacillus enclensis]MDM5338589.1 PRD domain-containing protein [Fictibacillus enclensis]
MKGLLERLELLKSSDSITETAFDICRKTIQKFVSENEADQYTMLITHLAMALTRIEREQELLPPPTDIMMEVYQSPKMEEARGRVGWIEKLLNQNLPEEEKEFLYLHFVNVLSA